MNTRQNSTPKDAGASIDLIDAIDLLHEVQEINEALFLAVGGISNRQHAGALQRIVSMSGDIMRMVADNLEAIRADARKGGAM